MNQAAQDMFLNRLAVLQAMMKDLQAKVDDHLSVDPDNLNWGHVGDVNHIIEVLSTLN